VGAREVRPSGPDEEGGGERPIGTAWWALDLARRRRRELCPKRVVQVGPPHDQQVRRRCRKVVWVGSERGATDLLAQGLGAVRGVVLNKEGLQRGARRALLHADRAWSRVDQGSSSGGARKVPEG
jgi:hypothetical protein